MKKNIKLYTAAVLSALFIKHAQARDYIVSDVRIDPSLTPRQTQYGNNEPKFLNRVFNLNGDTLSSDSLSDKCKALSRGKPISIGRWLGRQFLKNMDGNETPPKTRVPSDFHIYYPANTRAIEVTYKCSDPEVGPENPSQIKLPDGGLAISWVDHQVLLILTPLNQIKSLHPYFKCSPENNDTEKAICSDVELSGWDRSMIDDFKIVMLLAKRDDNPSDTVDKLVNFQRQWIKERNKCGADKACIVESYKYQMLMLSDAKINHGKVE